MFWTLSRPRKTIGSAVFDINGIPVAERDLAVRNVPISRADDNAIRLCQSIAAVRHLAINWLTGQSYLYSDVDTST